MKNKTIFGGLLILFAFVASLGNAQTCTPLSQGAAAPYQVGLSCKFNAASSAFTLNAAGISYWQILSVPVGTVSTASVSLDSSPDGVTFTVGGILSSATIGSIASAAQYTNSSPTVPSLFGRINPSVTGSGSVTVTLFGYTDNPASSGSATLPPITGGNTSGGLFLTSSADFSGLLPPGNPTNVAINLWLDSPGSYDRYTVFRSGVTGTSHTRDYLAWLDRDDGASGLTYRWLMGKNGQAGSSPNQFILYDPANNIHRWMFDQATNGNTFLASAGTGSVIICGNDQISAASCTGGLQVWGRGTNGTNAVPLAQIGDAGGGLGGIDFSGGNFTTNAINFYGNSTTTVVNSATRIFTEIAQSIVTYTAGAYENNLLVPWCIGATYNVPDICFSRIRAGVFTVGTSTTGDTTGAVFANGGFGQSFVTTAALTAPVPVKLDTSNANQVVVTTTTDTGAGLVVGICTNNTGIGGTCDVIKSGIIALTLGTGTCAIGNFVIVDTTTNGRVKCTSTYTAGTVIGVAMAAQSTVGSTFNVGVEFR